MNLRKGRILVFLVTFFAYLCVHIVRKPSSVLKSVLHPQDKYNAITNPGWRPFNRDLDPSFVMNAGLRVKGSYEMDANGIYSCTSRSDYQDAINYRCLSFANSNGFTVFQANILQCSKFNPTYFEPSCWFLANKRGNVLFVQFFYGNLPQPISNGDAKALNKSWRRVGRMNELSPDTKLKVVPHTEDGKVLLGIMDTVFLLAYTVGLVLSGYVADRVNIRYFLGLGMLLSGISSIFLGLTKRANVHSFAYFLLVSALGGFAQSTAWPCCLAVLGRWFPKEMGNRGLILGGWNACNFLGNILGSVITTMVVQWGEDGNNWPLGFEVPGFIVIFAGVLVLLFLQPHPPPPTAAVDEENVTSIEDPLLAVGTVEESTHNNNNEEATAAPPSVFRVFFIPGLLPFCVCLCFAKMGQYALLFWGPYYLQVVGFTSEAAGYLCSFFDVGGLFGAIGAGLLSDYLVGKRGTVACGFLLATSLGFFLYYQVTWHAQNNQGINIGMMLFVGFLVNGPVSLIVTAVSADLGSHPTLKGDPHLVATVAGIIDGSGSFGAAMQGVIIGLISSNVSWDRVFQFLSLCSLVAAMLLGGVVKKEWSPLVT